MKILDEDSKLEESSVSEEACELRFSSSRSIMSSSIYIRYESLNFTICNHFFYFHRKQKSVLDCNKNCKSLFDDLRSQAVRETSRFCRSTRMSTMTLRIPPSRADAHVVAAKFSNDFPFEIFRQSNSMAPFFSLGGHHYLYYCAMREPSINSENPPPFKSSLKFSCSESSRTQTGSEGLELSKESGRTDPSGVLSGCTGVYVLLIELHYSDNFLLGRRTRREMNSFER